MTEPTDEQIITQAAELARAGAVVDLDTIPERLWPRVLDATRDVQHDAWRARGWDVRRVACSNGCCESIMFTPPSRQPVIEETRSRCMRGVKHKILATYPGRSGIHEDA